MGPKDIQLLIQILNLQTKNDFFFFAETLTMPIKAEYLVVDSGGFIKNDLGGLHSMADHIITLHEVNPGYSEDLTDCLLLRWWQS